VEPVAVGVVVPPVAVVCVVVEVATDAVSVGETGAEGARGAVPSLFTSTVRPTIGLSRPTPPPRLFVAEVEGLPLFVFFGLLVIAIFY
jgi:hypothetical protein